MYCIFIAMEMYYIHIATIILCYFLVIIFYNIYNVCVIDKHFIFMHYYIECL